MNDLLPTERDKGASSVWGTFSKPDPLARMDNAFPEKASQSPWIISVSPKNKRPKVQGRLLAY